MNTEPLAAAIKAGARPVIFTFDTDTGFLGVTDDSRWNGFLNVRCTPETLEKIRAWFETFEPESAARDEWPAPGAGSGLVDLSGGYATSEAEWGSDAHVDAENALGDEVGHPEACSYTNKATTDEILEHLLTREPECDGFPVPMCQCGHPISAHQTGEGPWTGFCGECECEVPVPR